MDKYLALVNAQNRFDEEMNKDFDYIKIDVNKDMNENKEFIETETYKAFLQLKKELMQKGILLTINSAGRTVAEQKEFFDKEVEKNGLKKTKEEVALPGYSEHHLGLCIDVRIRSSNIITKVISKIMSKISDRDIIKATHSALTKYGFIVRYPEGKEDITGVAAESWHFRYVGVEYAKEMKTLGMCLEEYVKYLHKKEQEDTLSM